jgi:hypothetical protein
MRRIERLAGAVASSLRSNVVVTGFEQAVEELVCNSVDAGATQVLAGMVRFGMFCWVLRFCRDVAELREQGVILRLGCGRCVFSLMARVRL